MPAAAFYTTVPFGLTPQEHVAWVEAGGGQALCAFGREGLCDRIFFDTCLPGCRRA
jgi:hypothetical protein